MKEEGWWIVLGNQVTDELYALKRLSFAGNTTTLNLTFSAAEYEAPDICLFLICDSYLGLDQQYNIIPNHRR